MSSPQINNLIIAGCILSYTSVLLMGIDSTLLGKRSSESMMNFVCAVSFVFDERNRFVDRSVRSGARVDAVHWFHSLLRGHIQ